MPWDMVRNEQGKQCVYKIDAEGKPVGEALACHNTVEEAKRHMRALYAAEGEMKREALWVEAQISAPSTPEGKVWDVVLIGPNTPDDLITANGQEYILSQNGRAFTVEALRNSPSIWEGARVYDNHLTDAEFAERGNMRAPGKDWLGTITDVRFDEASRSLLGKWHVIDKPIREKLMEAYEQKVLRSVGLSIDHKPRYASYQLEYGGMSLPVVEMFEAANSVDLVGHPAAGGRLIRPIESVVTNDSEKLEVSNMNEEQVKAMIQDALGPVVQALDALKPKAGEAVDAKPEPAQVAGEATQEQPAVVEPVVEAKPEPAQAAPDTAALEAQIKVLQSQRVLDQRIVAAKLTPALEGMVRKAFDGRAFEAKELDEMLKDAKKAQADGDPSGKPNGAGAARESVSVGMSPEDKIEAEFLRLMLGNTNYRALAQAKDDFVIERFSEAYKTAIKQGFPNYGTRRLSEWVYNAFGDPLTGQRALEANVSTATMTTIIKNAVNVMLANDYSVRERWWDPIVRTEEVDTIDQATLARIYGMDTLDVVTEGNAYTEMDWSDEEETAAFVKKGNYIGITMETLLADKLNVIRSIPQRLANAWYNTLGDLVSAVFTTNTAAGPVLADTGALFNATAVASAGGHANLLTTALSYTAYDAARLAMMKQTDQTLGTGRRLLIQPRFVLVPADLETTANEIRNSEHKPNSANNDTNPFYQKFDIISVPNWTDTNNWALVADPQQWPAIWLIFYRGRRVPELFESTQDTNGAMFTNDTLRYKVRMMTYRYSSTYDCAPVSDWRGLHKSNVA